MLRARKQTGLKAMAMAMTRVVVGATHHLASFPNQPRPSRLLGQAVPHRPEPILVQRPQRCFRCDETIAQWASLRVQPSTGRSLLWLVQQEHSQGCASLKQIRQTVAFRARAPYRR
jgi:hypothetical protein